MQTQNDKPGVHTLVFQKAVIFILGILAGIVFLEVSIRTASTLRQWMQDKRMHSALLAPAKDSITIMCIGESTTQNKYPQNLQWTLDNMYPGKNIHVIDKGIAGINTDVLLEKLPDQIKQIKPDIIVAMMGCNDDKDNFIRFGNVQNKLDYWLVKNLKTYALMRFLFWQASPQPGTTALHTPTTQVNFPEPKNKAKILEKQTKTYNLNKWKENTIKDHFDTYAKLLEQGKLNDFFISSTFITNFSYPEDYHCFEYICHMLRKRYLHPNKPGYAQRLERLLDFFQTQASTQTEREYENYTLLSFLLTEEDNADPRSTQFAKDLFESFGNDLWLLEKLSHDSWFASNSHYCRTVTRSWHNTIANLSNPDMERAPISKALFTPDLFPLLEIEQDELIEKLEYCLQFYFYEETLYETLLNLYIKNSQPQKIAALYKYYMTHTPIPTLYMSQKWKAALDTANSLASTTFFAFNSPRLRKNYIKLASLCRENNITLICMQYPVLENYTLTRILKDYNVYFVSNEQNFKQAILKNGFGTYFEDSFAGCFGHATYEGRELIASNLAKTIGKIIKSRSK